MSISLLDVRRILHPQKKQSSGGTLKILDTWAEYEEGSNTNERKLEYLCYEMESIDPHTGQKQHYYKAIKLCRVIRIPKGMKQSTALMDMQTQVMTAVYEQEFNFICVIANIREPVALGLLFLYGVQGVSKTLDGAKEKARKAFVGLTACLQGTYRVLEMRLINAQETEWLREKLYKMEYTSVVRGIPKASRTGEDIGNKGMGGANLNPDSQGTLEELITGMADYEYVIEILTTPVHQSALKDWAARTRRQMTDWQEQMQGTKGFNFSLSIPMMYGANQGMSQGQSKGYSIADSYNVSQGTNFSQSYGENVGQALSQTYGQSFGKAYGQSFSESISQTHTVSQGVTVGHTVGVSFGQSQGQSVGQNVSQSQSYNQGQSTNQSFGRSFGESVGQNQGISQSQNIGQSFGTSRGVSSGFSTGQSAGVSSGQSSGVSSGQSAGFSSGQSAGISSGQSRGVSQGQSAGFSSGQSAGISSGQSRGVSAGQSFGTNTGISRGMSQGQSVGQSMGTSVGQSASFGRGVSSGQSYGVSSSQGRSQGYSMSDGKSVGQSFGQSESMGQSLGTSRTVGRSLGTSENYSEGLSEGSSRNMGGSYGTNSGTSMNAGHNIGSSSNQGVSMGQSGSVNAGAGQSSGQSYNMGTNVGESQNESVGESRGVSGSHGWNNATGVSAGSSTSNSVNATHNDTKSDTDTSASGWAAGGSLGGKGIGINGSVNGSTAKANSNGTSDGTGVGYGVSNSTSLSESAGESASIGESDGASYGYSQGASHGMSAGAGSNSGFNQSAGMSYSENLGRSNSIGSSEGYSAGFGRSVGESYGVNQSVGESQSVSSSHGTGISSSSSDSTGYSSGMSQTHGTSYGQNMGESHSESYNAGMSQSAGQSWGMNAGTSMNQSYSQNVGQSYSQNVGQSQSESISQSAGQSYGQNVGQSYSQNEGQSYSQNVGQSYSQNVGQSYSQNEGQSYSQNVGQSYSQNVGQSYSQNVGQSYSQNVGQSYSENAGQSQGSSYGMSQGTSQGSSYGQNVGMSESHGTGTSIGQSLGVSKGYSVSTNVGTSQTKSESQSYSVSQSESWSISHGYTKGESYTESESQSVSQGQTSSYGQSKGISQGKSSSTGYGQSQSQNIGYNTGITSGASASMGISPSLGYSKSYQWLDQQVKDIVEMLEYKNERLKNALRGNGAFYSYVYIACPSMDALSAAKTLAKSTWQNEEAMIEPLQVLDLDKSEQQNILTHCMGFSADVSMEDPDYFDDYKYCSVLLPKELVSYTHLPRISEGGLMVEAGDVPKFSVPSMLKGEIYMGTVLSPERYTMNHGYETPFEYRIDEKELMHMYFTGASRSGKTVTAMRFIAELSRVRRKSTGKRFRIVCMDPKQDWRALARYVEPERFHFYNMGNTLFRPLHLNPLKIPHGVIPQMWIDGVIDIYCRSYGLLERGKQMLGETIYQLYHEAGVFGYTPLMKNDLHNRYKEEYLDGIATDRNSDAAIQAADKYATERIEREDEDIKKNRDHDLISRLSSKVTFVDVYARMNLIKLSMEGDKEAEDQLAMLTGQRSKGKSGNDTKDAYARLLDRLQAFNREFSVERQLFGGQDGMSVDELIGADDVTVIESKGLESTFRNFVFGVITSGFYKYALAHEGGFLAEDQYETLLVIEEANEVLTGSDVAGTGGGAAFGLSGESEFEQILDQSAGYGLFICAITQKISDMPKSIIANAGLKFAGRLTIPDDVTTVIRSIAREDRYEDRDLVKWFPRSPTGWFICMSSRTYDFKDSEPVLVKVAPLNTKAPSNLDIEELLTEREVLIRNT